MASRKAASAKADWRTVFRQSIARSLVIAAAVALGLFTLFLTLALVTYDSTDAALNTAAHGTAANWMGAAGAWFADLGLSIGGAPIVLLLPLLGIIAWRLWTGEAQPYWPRQLAYSFIGILLVGLGAELWSPATNAPMPAGWGGIIALLIGGAVAPLFAQAGEPAAALIRFATILLLVGLGLWLAWRALRLEKGWASRFRLPAAEGSNRVIEPVRVPSDEVKAPSLIEDRVVRPRAVAEPSDRAPPEIADPAQRTAPSKPKPKPQTELFTNYQLPSIDLLAPPPPGPTGQIDKAGLERNARLLESVLEDFQVKGVVTAVRPGPVVTMYELEPAPGTKASRVSNLADDIARNMSALSARIAPIPGRTVIGIELPNAHRESVVLHEIIGSALFQDQTGALPIILGKNISGDAMIADLAPMPHLLIAGTTGSGKSVGLNAMILS
ncbi:MAG: DNA translocase FtsK 4TM domain-containing protein, partial [Sphingopyxis sp.]